MKLFKYGKYTIVCKSEGTRSGFRHLATLFRNDYEIARAKCTYLNRTWERYEFETVLSKVLRTPQGVDGRLFSDRKVATLLNKFGGYSTYRGKDNH